MEVRMKLRTRYLALGISAALVLAGVVLEGTDQNPWNLAISYFLPIATVEALMARRTWWSYALCALVSGLAIYGAVWTLGSQHAVSPRAALVYIGLVGAVMSSAMVPLSAEAVNRGE
jgi:ABC-type enterobactin transport system permease subunit